MSIQSEINRLKNNVAAAFTAIGNKGGTVPSSKVSGNLATAIQSIPDGVELNFEVVGGTSQPISPKENTIWVNTSTTISSWVFSATQPSNPSNGMVWISTGTSSTVKFNALKKNGIQVYPLSAKQMVSGALVDKTAKSYQGGKWVNWLPPGALYWDGVQCVKWVEKQGVIESSWVKKSPIYGSNSITLTTGATDNSNWFCGVVTDEKYDITGYTKLIVELEGTTTVYTGSDLNVCITSNKDENWNHNYSIAYKQYTADVPNIIEVPFNASGSYYITVFLIRMAQTTIKRIYLE